MKNKILKLDSPCNEKWEHMQPNETGSYCDLCAKNVIDFTTLNQVEISEIMQNSKNTICARLTQSQLELPLVYLDNKLELKIPKVAAAGLLLASSLTFGQTAHIENQTIQTEIIQNTDTSLDQEKQQSNAENAKQKQEDTIVFKGKVTFEDSKTPIENAKITFVSVQKLLTAYTAKDGTFSIEIPKSLIDNDNVIRVSYYEVKEERKDKPFGGYEEEDYILSKEEINSIYAIKASPKIFILGGISTSSKTLKPIVLSNGKIIKYRQFVKAQRGQKSSCNLENKKYLYFSPKYAMAICGKKAKDGLYILIDKMKA